MVDFRSDEGAGRIHDVLDEGRNPSIALNRVNGGRTR